MPAPATAATAAFSHESAAEAEERQLRAGIEAWKRGDWDLAELYLIKSSHAQTMRVRAVRALANLYADEAMACADAAEHVKAMRTIRKGQTVLEQAWKQILESDGPTEDLDLLVKADHQLEGAVANVETSVRQEASMKIARADKLAVEAHWRWYTFHQNDRNLVRDGLRELHWIRQRWELTDDQTRGEFARALQRLKDVVSDKEWDSLLASAGFVTERAESAAIAVK
jgi:hypothetical protein